MSDMTSPSPLIYKKDPAYTFEIGLDEAGRGPLFGRLYVAAVVLPPEGFANKDIKDSKKIKSAKKMKACYDYIVANAAAYSIQYVEHDVIDRINILQAVYEGMHRCIDDLYQKIAQLKRPETKTLILVDGDRFKPYVHFCKETDTILSPDCETVEGGDNKYLSIAAASILAKYSRDAYIAELCAAHPDLTEKYGLNTNMGYGTKAHMAGLEKYGVSPWHRLSYAPCQRHAHR
jgi:ribonuclease HII